MGLEVLPQTCVVVLVVFFLLLLSAECAHGQIYQPPAPYSMWDTWLFKDGDAYHLFFLQSEPGVTWNTIGRAVSKDLLHWRPLPPILSKGPAGAWDHDPTLTGMTVKHGGAYVMFYGSATHGQKIGVMRSPDLKTWEKHPDNPTLEIRPPHYAGGDWRDMCTFYDAHEKRWHGYVCAQTGAQDPQLPTIADKTLVAWVYLANTEQRGGSCLTLNNGNPPGDAFDAIVFGEKAPGRWMPGSEFWRRTQDDQAAWPLETAGPEERVQIAIAYAGNTVTVYRNGEQCVRYTVDALASFGNGTAVVMGLRHLGAGENSGRFFAGLIEEARVYNAALDAETIRALEPGKPSTPAPLAQWTFQDGSTADAMGTFPDGQLHGGAFIAGGRLHLDGVDDYFATPTRGPKACVAHLVSADLIAWDYLPPVFASTDFVDMEVPDYFELNGRHYLLFSSGRSRKDTSGRVNATGTYYVMGDHRDGPYRVPPNPLLLGSGRGRFDNYVGRTVPFEDTRLLYHHTAGGPVTWGIPKVVRQDEDGGLWLEYWPGLKGLETRVLFEDPKAISLDDQTETTGWTLQENAVTCRAEEGRTAAVWLPVTPADAMVACTVALDECASAGIVWRWDGERGAGLTVNRETDTAAVGAIALVDGALVSTLIDDCSAIEAAAGSRHLRVVIRAHRAEVYIDDRWIFGTSLPDLPATGRIGLLAQSGAATFTDLRVAELEKLGTDS